jgi:hypothetical protein
MKSAILAVLLLLAVTALVSGAPAEVGKSRYGDETCLAVILHTLQLYKFVSLLNYELRHDECRNAGKIPGILIGALPAKVQMA